MRNERDRRLWAPGSMFQELAEGVFRRRYASLDLNVGVVVSDTGVLIVDTRASHIEADELREELGTLTTLPVRWAIDTHWHWDHTFGNSRFPEAEIWGHRRCMEVMQERGDSMKDDATAWLPERRAEFEAVQIVTPSRVFSQEAHIDMGTRRVTMSYHGRGHTDADIVVSVDGVRFMGDLLEGGGAPVFDDGYPMSWPDTLESALGIGASVFVPGHGDIMDLPAARTQLMEIEMVAVLARRCIEDGMSISEAARGGPYPEAVMTSALQRALAVRL